MVGEPIPIVNGALSLCTNCYKYSEWYDGVYKPRTQELTIEEIGFKHSCIMLIEAKYGNT